MKCTSNHIVLLSDGAPNANTYTEYDGETCSTDTLFEPGKLSDEPGDQCSYKIADWANKTDLMEGAGWDGVQNITLSTMGFYTSGDTRTFLKRLAESGGGEYYNSDGGTLVQDLTDIITDAQTNIDYVYNEPAIPFNPDNAAVSGDEIYVPMFLPEDRLSWKGNLKKYRITITDNDVVLTALNNDRVLNDAQEFQSTRDLFCDDDRCAPDEGAPLAGGVAQDMTEVRKLYTYLGKNTALTSTANRVRNANKTITADMLGVATKKSRTELLNWITRDPDYKPTKENPSHSGVMGAPIHTQPLVVSYSDGDVVLIPTSEGVLEAIDASDDFSKLGQTWSKPLFVKMKIDGTVREVLVFGGGYNPDQDDATLPAEDYSDDEGNAIFIVKAEDGTLLKSISDTGAKVNIPDMTFAIPSDLATVDLNGNAVVERLYASDVGGRIIRIDIDEDDEYNTITGGIIADINEGASAHRKFFTTPQIGYYSKAGIQFLPIMIGTGDIANPVDRNVTDRFYVIKDTYVWEPPDYAATTHGEG